MSQFVHDCRQMAQFGRESDSTSNSPGSHPLSGNFLHTPTSKHWPRWPGEHLRERSDGTNHAEFCFDMLFVPVANLWAVHACWLRELGPNCSSEAGVSASISATDLHATVKEARSVRKHVQQGLLLVIPVFDCGHGLWSLLYCTFWRTVFLGFISMFWLHTLFSPVCVLAYAHFFTGLSDWIYSLERPCRTTWLVSFSVKCIWCFLALWSDISHSFSCWL